LATGPPQINYDGFLLSVKAAAKYPGISAGMRKS
jgi:hypothetical protein